MLDVDAVRRRFPALQRSPQYIFSENAGGSQVLGTVPERIADYMTTCNVQMANYQLASEAAGRIRQGYAAAALFAGVEVDNIMFGSSATQLAFNLASMIGASIEGGHPDADWKKGDEIIITSVDHESNRGAWYRLANRFDLDVKVWSTSTIDGASGQLQIKDLTALLTSRTKLVAFTACSNVVGSLVDIRAACEEVRKATNGKAYTVVDAVAFAPHRLLRPREWNADFVLWSWYKVYGPHIGCLAVSDRSTPMVTTILDAQYKEERNPTAAKAHGGLLTPLNHHFLHGGAGMYPFQPSSQQYELIVSITAIVDYLLWLGQTATGEDASRTSNNDFVGMLSSKDRYASGRRLLEAAYGAIAQHEESVCEAVLDQLTSTHFAGLPLLQVVGHPASDGLKRVPTVAFIVKVEGSSAAVAQQLVKSEQFGIQQGHMYAEALIKDDLKLDVTDGVIRVSLVHYNTVDEARKVGEAIKKTLLSIAEATTA